MLTFQTLAQYLQACTERTANSYRPPAAPFFWTCETCGKCAPHTESYGIRRHAHGPDSMHCYGCCHASDVAELLDRSKPFFAYVSGDGRNLSNWPGSPLGRIYNYAESRTGWNGGKIARFRVQDVHGNWWSGRGPGKGMYCTLRPMKAPKD
jgi:hypothetical protein